MDKKPKGAEQLIAEGKRLAKAAGLTVPGSLGRWGRQCWNQAIGSVATKGDLALLDLPALEMMCRQYDIWATAERVIAEAENAEPGSGEFVTTPSGTRKISPARITANRALDQYLKLARLFGVTPVIRRRATGSSRGDLIGRISDEPPATRREPGGDPRDPFVPLMRDRRTN